MVNPLISSNHDVLLFKKQKRLRSTFEWPSLEYAMESWQQQFFFVLYEHHWDELSNNDRHDLQFITKWIETIVDVSNVLLHIKFSIQESLSEERFLLSIPLFKS